jgi:hypothetical protein
MHLHQIFYTKVVRNTVLQRVVSPWSKILAKPGANYKLTANLNEANKQIDGSVRLTYVQ